jgi:hypothetical protein
MAPGASLGSSDSETQVTGSLSDSPDSLTILDGKRMVLSLFPDAIPHHPSPVLSDGTSAATILISL